MKKYFLGILSVLVMLSFTSVSFANSHTPLSKKEQPLQKAEKPPVHPDKKEKPPKKDEQPPKRPDKKEQPPKK